MQSAQSQTQLTTHTTAVLNAVTAPAQVNVVHENAGHPDACIARTLLYSAADSDLNVIRAVLRRNVLPPNAGTDAASSTLRHQLTNAFARASARYVLQDPAVVNTSASDLDVRMGLSLPFFGVDSGLSALRAVLACTVLPNIATMVVVSLTLLNLSQNASRQSQSVPRVLPDPHAPKDNASVLNVQTGPFILFFGADSGLNAPPVPPLLNVPLKTVGMVVVYSTHRSLLTNVSKNQNALPVLPPSTAYKTNVLALSVLMEPSIHFAGAG